MPALTVSQLAARHRPTSQFTVSDSAARHCHIQPRYAYPPYPTLQLVTTVSDCATRHRHIRLRNSSPPT
ncbi:hypothetical protein BJ508DRAFT_329801 [Ascobolus immersus RN42]|uniref:Uncharacterized protein n=1 Tax=Ascobolus immersus RN42 TaxID=1160509 RepID=A0A3N4HXU4_ASCIM|nr:hypothetical protein BJ508DRAFT_329801 [Ascobolus immersus RN42]